MRISHESHEELQRQYGWQDSQSIPYERLMAKYVETVGELMEARSENIRLYRELKELERKQCG